jgi:predicted component of type VI protein secretion system
VAPKHESRNQHDLPECRQTEKLEDRAVLRAILRGAGRGQIVRDSADPDRGDHQQGRLQRESHAKAKGLHQLP